MTRFLVLVALVPLLTPAAALGQKTVLDSPGQHARQQRCTAADDHTVPSDRSAGREEKRLTICIHPDLPPYTFHLIPDRTKKDFSVSECPCHIGRIEITRGGSSAIRQRIEVVTENVDISFFLDGLGTADINFDGYLDIGVLYAHGGTWGSMSYWVFDPRSGRFVATPFTKEFREVGAHETVFDPQAKEIHTSHIVAGCADTQRTYRIVGGHLVLVRAEERELREPGDCIVTTKQRVKGELKVLTIGHEPSGEVPTSQN